MPRNATQTESEPAINQGTDAGLLGELDEFEELEVVNPGSGGEMTEMTGISDDTPPILSEPAPEIVPPAKPKAKRAERGAIVDHHISTATTRVPGIIGAAPKPENYIPTPSPRFTRYFSNSDDPNRRTAAFYKYWSQLGPAALTRCIAYVYREWPVLLPIPDDSKENAYIDKIPAEQIIRDDIEFADRYGAGDYKVYFNEELPLEVAKKERTKTSRTLAELYIRGSRDLKSRPPSDRRISDVRNVSLTDPQNPAYVEFLRMQGHLPNQIEEIRRQGDVATVQAVDRMAQMNENLTQKLIERADKRSDSDSSVSDAAAKAVGVVADAATRSNQMMQETFAQIRAQQGDGTAMLTTALEIAEKIGAAARGNGNGGGNGDGGSSRDSAIVTELMSEIRELRGKVSDMQAAQIASLERRLEQMALRPTMTNADGTSTAGNPATPMDAVKQSIGAFKEVKNLVDEITGGGDGDEGKSDGPGWLKYASQIAPVVGQVVTAARDMYALSTMGNTGQQPGQSQRPQQPVQYQNQQPQPQPQPQQQFQPSQTQPQQSQPQPIQPPTNVVEMPSMPSTPSNPAPGLDPDIVYLLHAIRFPFLNHFEDYCMGGPDCLDGAAFADWFIGGFTEDTFNNIKAGGADTLMAALFAFPPIATELNRINRLDKLVEFTNQFVSFKTGSPVGADGDGGGGTSEQPPDDATTLAAGGEDGAA